MVIDGTQFWSRVKAFYATWKGAGLYWGGETAVNSMILHHGKDNDGDEYARYLSAMRYFFGQDVENMIMLFTKSKLYIMAKAKTTKLFEPLLSGAGEIGLELLTATESQDNQNLYSTLANAATVQGRRIGFIAKQPDSGKFVNAFLRKLEEGKVDMIDVSMGWGLLFAQLDERGISNITTAAHVTTRIFKKYVFLVHFCLSYFHSQFC